MYRKNLFLIFTIFSFLFITSCQEQKGTFMIGETDFLLNGKPYVIRSGEMHFMRIPEAYWEHRLKMARAMGLNTVCAYMFWNAHEERPGEFKFSGRRDVAKFCRLAQKEGLYVILRPGPYSCAEWEFGGFPWWLLKKEDLKLRTRDPFYIEHVKQYLMQVGKQLAPLQITKGGPIIMVQVENEYGSYGNDTVYMGMVRDILKEAGFEVPLFACDGPSQMVNDKRSDLFSVVNFGGNPKGAFKALRKLQPSGPLMCGEYYPGWFDSWGKPHHTGQTAPIIKNLEWMLDHRASFSIYMAHGGTSFGLWSGANCPPFSPQTSSYDYDAPISEAGWETEKFDAIRKLFSRYLQEGESLPDPPAKNPVITIPQFEVTEMASVFDNLPAGIIDEHPHNMEQYDQGYGFIVYSTVLPPAASPKKIHVDEVHDFAVVFLDGKRIATIDRRKTNYIFEVPAHTSEAKLEIFVEAMGRVNYGGYIHDRKGITRRVEYLNEAGKTEEITGWTVHPFALSSDRAPGGLTFGDYSKTGEPAFYRAVFTLEKTGDVFLDVRKWGKGLVWVNGHGLGRFWNIGPTQTMYLPGPWLRKGENEVIILDVNGPEEPVLQGLDRPILEEMHVPEVVRHRKHGQNPDLGGLKPVVEGTFAPGKEWKKVKFGPVTARYIALEALSSQRGDPFTTIAEICLLDPSGKKINRDHWKVLYADSEELGGDDGNATNVFDLQFTSFWHTQWMGAQPAHPHLLILDLGAAKRITGMEMLPRQDSPNGRIKDYRVFVSRKLFKGV
jgi:beta-galactosidase